MMEKVLLENVDDPFIRYVSLLINEDLEWEILYSKEKEPMLLDNFEMSMLRRGKFQSLKVWRWVPVQSVDKIGNAIVNQ